MPQRTRLPIFGTRKNKKIFSTSFCKNWFHFGTGEGKFGSVNWNPEKQNFVPIGTGEAKFGSTWNRRSKIWFHLESEKQNLVPIGIDVRDATDCSNYAGIYVSISPGNFKRNIEEGFLGTGNWTFFYEF